MDGSRIELEGFEHLEFSEAYGPFTPAKAAAFTSDFGGSLQSAAQAAAYRIDGRDWFSPRQITSTLSIYFPTSDGLWIAFDDGSDYRVHLPRVHKWPKVPVPMETVRDEICRAERNERVVEVPDEVFIGHSLSEGTVHPIAHAALGPIAAQYQEWLLRSGDATLDIGSLCKEQCRIRKQSAIVGHVHLGTESDPRIDPISSINWLDVYGKAEPGYIRLVRKG